MTFQNGISNSLAIHFADDTTTANSHVFLAEVTQKIDILWIRLKIGSKKTNYHWTTQKLNMIFALRSLNIINHTQVKFLDIVLYQSQHVDYVSKKLASVIFIIRILTKLVSPPILKLGYYALFQEVFSYALLA